MGPFGVKSGSLGGLVFLSDVLLLLGVLLLGVLSTKAVEPFPDF